MRPLVQPHGSPVVGFHPGRVPWHQDEKGNFSAWHYIYDDLPVLQQGEQHGSLASPRVVIA